MVSMSSSKKELQKAAITVFLTEAFEEYDRIYRPFKTLDYSENIDDVATECVRVGITKESLIRDICHPTSTVPGRFDDLACTS